MKECIKLQLVGQSSKFLACLNINIKFSCLLVDYLTVVQLSKIIYN